MAPDESCPASWEPTSCCSRADRGRRNRGTDRLRRVRPRRCRPEDRRLRRTRRQEPVRPGLQRTARWRPANRPRGGGRRMRPMSGATGQARARPEARCDRRARNTAPRPGITRPGGSIQRPKPRFLEPRHVARTFHNKLARDHPRRSDPRPARRRRAGLTAETKGQLLAGGGVRARFRFAATTENKSDRNVIGFFPGSDPEKKKEIVVFRRTLRPRRRRRKGRDLQRLGR